MVLHKMPPMVHMLGPPGHSTHCLSCHTVALNTYLICIMCLHTMQGLLGGDSPTLCVHISSNVASIGGFEFPQALVYAYRASKAALNMLVRTSVEELTDKNITSVLLHPGGYGEEFGSVGSA